MVSGTNLIHQCPAPTPPGSQGSVPSRSCHHGGEDGGGAPAPEVCELFSPEDLLFSVSFLQRSSWPRPLWSSDSGDCFKGLPVSPPCS